MSKNFLNFSLLVAAILGGQMTAAGQELHLKARDGNTPRSISKEETRAAQSGPVHQIVQFDHLPGVADLNALLAAGYKVIAAVPDNAVMVVGPSAVTVQIAGASWIGQLQVSDKLSPSLGKSASSAKLPTAK
jgi:hypothetical protein